VICSITSPEAVLQRASLLPRKLSDPAYLRGVLAEQQKLQHPEHWTLAALDPLEGMPLTGNGVARPGLLVGLSHFDIRDVTQRLLDLRLLPQRLEFGVLPLLGAIARDAERRGEKRATVVVVIEQDHTAVYIIGKEGVHTPATLRHGFSSIVQAVSAEFGLHEAAEVRERLNQADDELLLRAGKFVRAIGRDLKPLLGSYEMTTGQPVGEIHCAYLPASLQWIAEPLARMVQLPVYSLDFTAWLPTAGSQPAEGLPELGSHWMGALSLMTRPAESGKTAGEKAGGPPSWRVDFQREARISDLRPVTRRFAAPVVATSLALFVLVFALWQWSVVRALDQDTDYWNQQMASNQKVVGELTRATRALRTKSARFDQASELVSVPFQLTDFILNLGRSLPPNMRVDRIEANRNRVAMSGSLREPPEQSSRILGRYMEALRNTPAIGPLFSSIELTSLQRDRGAEESLTFEITFTIKNAPP
jgi:hypothetical protein